MKISRRTLILGSVSVATAGLMPSTTIAAAPTSHEAVAMNTVKSVVVRSLKCFLE